MTRRAIAGLAAALLVVSGATLERRTAAASEPRAVYVFYNVYAGVDKQRLALARSIVTEQLTSLRASPLWPFVAELRFSTIGAPAVKKTVKGHCAAHGMECVHLGHVPSGDEVTTLSPLHEFCSARPDASVAYIHDKGAFHDWRENRHLRGLILRGLASRPCRDAVANGTCDVCQMRFSAHPHQHSPGNMWLARCAYVAELLEPRDFQVKMSAHWNNTTLGANLKPEHHPMLGLRRFALEHWVGSHPAVRPCDVLDHPYHAGYAGMPPADYAISFAAAPRYARSHPFIVGFQHEHGFPLFRSSTARWKAMKDEWAALYQASPPADSPLRAHFLGPIVPRNNTASRRGRRVPRRGAHRVEHAICYAKRYPRLAKVFCNISRHVLCDVPGLVHHFNEYGRRSHHRWGCRGGVL